MTDANTRKTTTAHGEIEYETVECDSCGSEMLKKDANHFEIGEREGVACDYCVDEGPAGFPAHDPLRVVNFLSFIWFAPIGAIVMLDETDDIVVQTFYLTFVSAIFWTLIGVWTVLYVVSLT